MMKPESHYIVAKDRPSALEFAKSFGWEIDDAEADTYRTPAGEKVKYAGELDVRLFWHEARTARVIVHLGFGWHERYDLERIENLLDSGKVFRAAHGPIAMPACFALPA